ncbi:hypothetical protein PAQ31011_04567 [Pandoraea aquatica]|uniref:Uncharacterized protein n=1 Tax=Pandoraea aquatica TaxID=2508290 RepID=A0A5E4YJ97_9BURK|nr:hypothetical protein [Pandoraea aquatica]VVE48607.1 hypothetical protein PAQ31011_04567 [Pandoraea aquatica]
MPLPDDLRDYTNLTHANAWRRHTGKPKNGPDEPAYVSSLLLGETFRGLRATIRSYATPGTLTQVRGIFTHQTPKVKLATGGQSVEMGDLMFVHRHFSPHLRQATFGRALLLQAKRTLTPKTGSLASKTQPIQFRLYRDWPLFEGVTRIPQAPIGATAWDFHLSGVTPASPPQAGSAYMTIFPEQAYTIAAAVPQWMAPLQAGVARSRLKSKGYPQDCTWAVGASPAHGTHPRAGVSCPTDFGTALTDFLSGKIGRPFVPGAMTATDHWSYFVNQMLLESGRANGNYRYTATNQNVTSAPRGRNIGFMAWENVLEHSIANDQEAWREGLGDGGSPPFEFSRSVLAIMDRLARDRRAEGGPPDETPETVFVPSGGHVPLLLVTTIGNDCEPFNVGERG